MKVNPTKRVSGQSLMKGVRSLVPGSSDAGADGTIAIALRGRDVYARSWVRDVRRPAGVTPPAFSCSCRLRDPIPPPWTKASA